MLANYSFRLTKEIAYLKNIRVFVVEPDLAVAEVLTFMLEAEGAEVQVAHALNRAIDVLAQFQPDLLICNLKLPDGDGYSLLHYCQQLKRSTAQPIRAIAIAHSPWKIDRQKALSAGFHYYLFEPMEYSTLMGRVTQVLQQRSWQP